MDPSEEFKSQQKKILAALVAANRTVNSIASEDLTFQRTVNPEVASRLDDSAARLLRLTNSLLSSAATATGKKAPPALEDADDVDLRWQSVVDVIDSLLEKADTTLDEYTGLLKRKDAPTGEAGPEFKKPKQTTDKLEWSIRRANIAKPQDLFDHKPDNFDEKPWKPLLTAKPHAIVPLADSITSFVDENNNVQYKHPYETEITKMHYPEAVYQKKEPIPYLPVETTKATWVDTFEGVQAMLEELREADEIAVDLEHHDFRSYTGLLSLMQISTRKKDWIVDTLQPWRHRLEILNEVFADPRKLKVFHGATSDIVWLQRDLGLYIVGLFDTYFACESLGYPARSLAYLLKHFVNFDADKKYQMADWRIRPLPEEMLYYARSDTHYLLYVYDNVRNELAAQKGSDGQASLTDYVLQRSKETSLLRHEALLCDMATGQGVRGWFNNLVKSYATLTGEQFAVYKALFKWRDDLARHEDESPGYIMPMRTLSDVARILPPDRKALWSLLTNTARVAKAQQEELFNLIQAARKEGANGPTSLEFLKSHTASGTAKTAFGAWKGSVSTSGQTAAAAAATAAAAESKEREPLPDVGELRSNSSQLWGSIPMDSSKKAKAGLFTSEKIEVPWFSFVQGAPVVPGAAEATAATLAKGLATEEYIEIPGSATMTTAAGSKKMGTEGAAVAAVAGGTSESDDEEFTLRDGKKSKTRAAKEGGEEAKGEVDDAARAAKKAARAARKEAKEAAKKAKKEKDGKGGKAGQAGQAGKAKGASSDAVATPEAVEAKESSDSDGGARIDVEMEDEDGGRKAEFTPFNYDTAGSVLHAKPSADAYGGGSGKKRVFNPYRNKTMADGPKAARQMHHEKVGKSGTFKK